MVKRVLPFEGLQRYTKETVCSSTEVKRLWERFCKLNKRNTGQLVQEELLVAPELQSNPFASRIVELCSENGTGDLTFQQMVDMFCLFHPRTSTSVKVAWAFAIWDFDGDDVLGASDLKQGLQLLANGFVSSTADPNFDDSPAMFDDEAPRVRQTGRRKSVHADLLSPHEISQVLQRIAKEIEPLGNAISFPEFEAVVSCLPDFAANFRINF